MTEQEKWLKQANEEMAIVLTYLTHEKGKGSCLYNNAPMLMQAYKFDQNKKRAAAGLPSLKDEQLQKYQKRYQDYKEAVRRQTALEDDGCTLFYALLVVGIFIFFLFKIFS